MRLRGRLPKWPERMSENPEHPPYKAPYQNFQFLTGHSEAGDAPRSSLGRLFGGGRGYVVGPPNWPHAILKQLYLHKVFL